MCLLRHVRQPLGLLVLAAFATASSAAQEPKAVLMRLNRAGKLEVVVVDVRQIEKSPPTSGLLIWPVGDDEERWAFLTPKWKMPGELANLAGVPGSLRLATRGPGASTSGAELSAFTVQLEAISPDTSTRSVGVYPLTPAADGRLLNPRPTFRRLALEKEPRFPAALAMLTSENLAKPLLVRFAVGKDRVTWEEIQDLPAEAKTGLPAGRYMLGPQKGLEGNFVTFHVEESQDRAAILRPVETLATLLDQRTDPVRLQFHFEHLLRFRGENEAPLYLSDALDLLESVPEKELTPHLRRQRTHLIRCLQAEPGKRGEALATVAPPGDITGIPELETVRKWIASNRWREALAALAAPALQEKMANDPRTAGLAHLYRGVVLAESGPLREAEAYAAFTEAFRNLEGGAAPDRFRAHVNYANFLQRAATDRIHNHALQMAAGVSRPFLTMMDAWIEANANYEAALVLADQLEAPGQKAAVQVNLARLHALLADLIRTLDDPEHRAFLAGEKLAAATARELALSVADSADADVHVRGIAEEVRAMLAFRAKDDVEAAAAARRALTLHVDVGHLAGAENVYRLLGLIAERKGDKQNALRMFQAAQLISESLRERFPSGNAGLTRAGFFARKTYASDKIVELLLAEDRIVEALHVLEQSRARSLQDVLAARNLGSAQRTPALADVLAKWPTDAAAVEYFLGADHAYVFVVAPGGKVTAHLLRDKKGDPVAPRELITGVRRLLWDMEKQASKMYGRLVARKGYDHSWQDELHRLHHELLPASARQQLKGAKVIVVVPQHILHYFPFAALVTEPDGNATKKKMARPRFLMDEPFDLVYAPSLLSWRRLPAATARQVSAVGVAEAPGAPALEGVTKDLANLQAIFGPQVKGVLEGDNARASEVKKLLKERGLLFFGVHGLNVADQPLESHLMLMPDKEHDGRLTAADLFAGQVNAEIVVMSACYSGLGDRSPLPGDDLFGLQRALLHSGVRTVVSGLWDVYDGTAPELMRELFKGLKDGQPIAASLASSQRAFLKRLRASESDEPWLHPYFWAVYTATGDDRTRFEK